MRSFFESVMGYFLTPWGLVLLGVLDSSVVFFLPLGIDFVVIILTAREPQLFWLYALLATIGSVAGVAVTFWIGRKVGEHGLSRFMRESTRARVQQRLEHGGAVTIAALGAVPPPFPFTAFVLASGAGRVNPWTFLSALTVVRLIRFMVEAALAVRFGSGILTWMESTTFTVVVIGIAVVAVVGTIVSAVVVYRKVRQDESTGRGKRTGWRAA